MVYDDLAGSAQRIVAEIYLATVLTEPDLARLLEHHAIEKRVDRNARPGEFDSRSGEFLTRFRGLALACGLPRRPKSRDRHPAARREVRPRSSPHPAARRVHRTREALGNPPP